MWNHDGGDNDCSGVWLLVSVSLLWDVAQKIMMMVVVIIVVYSG